MPAEASLAGISDFIILLLSFCDILEAPKVAFLLPVVELDDVSVDFQADFDDEGEDPRTGVGTDPHGEVPRVFDEVPVQPWELNGDPIDEIRCVLIGTAIDLEGVGVVLFRDGRLELDCDKSAGVIGTGIDVDEPLLFADDLLRLLRTGWKSSSSNSTAVESLILDLRDISEKVGFGGVCCATKLGLLLEGIGGGEGCLVFLGSNLGDLGSFFGGISNNGTKSSLSRKISLKDLLSLMNFVRSSVVSPSYHASLLSFGLILLTRFSHLQYLSIFLIIAFDSSS